MWLPSFLRSRPHVSHGELPGVTMTAGFIQHRLGLLGLLAVACALFAITAAAQTNPKHFFWAPNQPNTPNPSSLANDLIYHGGNAGTGRYRSGEQPRYGYVSPPNTAPRTEMG
jgi:hypothetical protein